MSDYKSVLSTMDSNTQCYRVLDYLIKNGSITTFEAFTELGITRLSARVFELENDHLVEFRREKFRNNKTWFTRYSLI